MQAKIGLIQEFKQMQKKFGWKYELYGGEIHASPWEIFIVYETEWV